MKDHFPTYDRHPEVVRQCGRFRPNGNSAPDNTLNKGLKGVTITRDDVGDFTATFDEVGYDLLDAKFTLWSATPVNSTVTPGAYDSSAKTLKFFCRTADTGADLDPASDADTWISIDLTWQNTDI